MLGISTHYCIGFLKMRSLNAYFIVSILCPEIYMYEKSFITSELIESYVYHDVDYERLVEFNKKCCRFHGKNFRDFQKIKEICRESRLFNSWFC